MKYFFIALGGTIGALSRYLVSGWAQSFFYSYFPWGTLCVNIAGSLIIGMAWGILDYIIVSDNFKMLIFVGILGSFTTFSSFSLETFHLLRDGEYSMAIINITVSVIFCIACVFAGFFAARFVLEAVR